MGLLRVLGVTNERILVGRRDAVNGPSQKRALCLPAKIRWAGGEKNAKITPRVVEGSIDRPDTENQAWLCLSGSCRSELMKIIRYKMQLIVIVVLTMFSSSLVL